MVLTLEHLLGNFSNLTEKVYKIDVELHTLFSFLRFPKVAYLNPDKNQINFF